MKVMICPVNGARSISEFVYGGEVRSMPEPQAVDDATWASYIFNRSGSAGIKQEWWCHTPSNTWFIAERNTQTDEVLRTYLYSKEVEA